MKRWIAAVLLAGASVPAWAGGIYIGAGLGKGTIRDEPADPSGTSTFRFDSKDTSYKAFLGYRFSWLPIFDLAAEAAYTDFGNPAQTTLGQNVEYKLHGGSVAGLLILPLGPIDLFGKAGAMEWKSEKNIGGTVSSKSGTNAVYGAGIGVKVWKIGLRAEYERFDVKAVDRAEMVSVSAVFQF
jgi:hypothetical protein